MSRQHHEHRPSKREREAKAATKERKRTLMAARVKYAVALAAWDGVGPRPVDPASASGRIAKSSSPWRKGPAGAQHSTWATTLHVGRR